MATSKLSGAVEQWLSAAERLYGPYMWGRYVLFLGYTLELTGGSGARPGAPCLTLGFPVWGRKLHCRARLLPQVEGLGMGLLSPSAPHPTPHLWAQV
jgi:hypothetical protein